MACRAHKRFPPKYDLWPYKRRNTRGSITKKNKRVDFTEIHLHPKYERNPSRNAADRAHTRFPPKYDLWPYKRRNTAGSITTNYRCVDLTMMHICTKFERNPSRNVACRAHTRFPPKYDLWPYKRRNTGGSITKNNKRVDFYQDTPPYIITSEVTSSIQTKRFQTHRAERRIRYRVFIRTLNFTKPYLPEYIFLLKKKNPDFNENLGFGLAVHTEFVKFGENFT